MPNYVAHELFGARVKAELSGELRSAVERELLAFRCGLYGPDPLIFLPGGLSISRRLHGNWREESGTNMQRFLEEGTAAQRSFAAGYLCHLLLDDVCHERIYALMREQGLSHRVLEVGLDWSILRDLGARSFHRLAAPGRNKVGRLAEELVPPAQAGKYRAGLSSMGLICKTMDQVRRCYGNKIDGEYRAPVAELFGMLEQQVLPSAQLLLGMSQGMALPGSLIRAC